MTEFEEAMAAGIVQMPMPGIPAVVETPPAAPPPIPETPPPAPVPNPYEAQLQQMQQQYDQLQRRYQESDDTARYWAEMAARTATPVAAPAPAQGPIDPEVFAADLSRRGPAALEGIFVTQAQVEQMITAQATRIADERARAVTQESEQRITFSAQLASEFPDLHEGTPFYNEAVQEARRLVKFDPNLASSNSLLVAAAGIVKARHGATSAAATEATRVAAAAEQVRLQQIAAQTGAGGGGVLPGSTLPPPINSPLTNAFFREVAGGEVSADDMAALRAGTYVPQSRRRS